MSHVSHETRVSCVSWDVSCVSWDTCLMCLMRRVSCVSCVSWRVSCVSRDTCLMCLMTCLMCLMMYPDAHSSCREKLSSYLHVSRASFFCDMTPHTYMCDVTHVCVTWLVTPASLRCARWFQTRSLLLFTFVTCHFRVRYDSAFVIVCCYPFVSHMSHGSWLMIYDMPFLCVTRLLMYMLFTILIHSGYASFYIYMSVSICALRAPTCVMSHELFMCVRVLIHACSSCVTWIMTRDSWLMTHGAWHMQVCTVISETRSPPAKPGL